MRMLCLRVLAWDVPGSATRAFVMFTTPAIPAMMAFPAVPAVLRFIMPDNDSFSVGLIQMSCSPEPEENLGHAVEKVRQAAKKGAQIICLPELFRTEYFCQREDHALFDLAEPIPGPTTEALAPVARETGAVIVASIFERRARGLYHNTAAVLESDGTI